MLFLWDNMFQTNFNKKCLRKLIKKLNKCTGKSNKIKKFDKNIRDLRYHNFKDKSCFPLYETRDLGFLQWYLGKGRFISLPKKEKKKVDSLESIWIRF